MKSSVSILLSVVTLFSGARALAQSSLEGFSTGRYEIHKSSKSAKSSRKPSSVEGEESKPVTDADGTKIRLLTPSELEAEKAAEAKATAEAQAKKIAEQKAVPNRSVDDKTITDKKLSDDQKLPEVSLAAADAEEPTISEQAESLFSSQAEKVYDYYRQEIHSDDIRNNKVEVEFSPLLGYNDSTSNYSFRKYQSFFEALKLKANVWLTPLIGVSGQILFSFGADIDDANRSKVSAKYENLDLGLNFRKFFGVSRKSNSMEFSVLYSDNNFKVSKDSTLHPRIKSSGVGVGLKGRFPTSMNYAWIVGGTFFPRLQHSESATAVNVSSGSPDENTRIGFEVGGEWKFSRHSQMIWSLGATSEKNLFTGAATFPDSSTGLTPSGVSVTNTMYLMNLGYRWGH